VPGPPTAPTCLLIHGWQATADLNFFPLFGPLGERHRVVAADLRGHGRSTYTEDSFTLEAAADDNAALLHALGVERAIVVGYSLGSAVAQVMVARHPELVAGLVLGAGELCPNRQPRLKKAALRLGGWVGTLQRLTEGRRSAHSLVRRAKRTNPTVESLRGWLVAEMERGHSGSLRAAGRALGRFDGSSLAASASVPAASVITLRDRLVPQQQQRVLAGAWRAHAATLDADHDAPIARPEAFADAMLAAIDHVAHATGPVRALA
jgi:3-oxoadipate enol-lactonase